MTIIYNHVNKTPRSTQNTPYWGGAQGRKTRIKQGKCSAVQKGCRGNYPRACWRSAPPYPLQFVSLSTVIVASDIFIPYVYPATRSYQPNDGYSSPIRANHGNVQTLPPYASNEANTEPHLELNPGTAAPFPIEYCMW